MTPGRTSKDYLPWRQLLQLSEQLFHLNTPADQCRLIEHTASGWFKGSAHVWLAETAYQLPGMEIPPLFPPLPTDERERIAFETRSIQRRTPLDPVEPRPSAEPTPGFLAAPLITRDVILGVVSVERPSGPAFRPAEEDFLKRMAGAIAVTLQATRQAAIKNWRFEQLSLVRSVSARITKLQDLDELARQVTQLIRDTFHYNVVAIYTLEPGEKELHFRALASSIPSLPQEPVAPAVLSMGEGMVGAAAEHGVEMIAPDIRQEPRFRPLQGLPDSHSAIALPLKIENRVLGVLDVESSQVDAFHEMDILVLRALVDNIALAVEGIYLLQDVRKRAEQLSLVAEVSRAITSILEPEALLNEVAELIHTRFGFPFVHLFSIHPGRRLVTYQAGSGPRSQILKEQAYTINLDEPVGMIAWVARNGKTLLANDVRSEPLYRPWELPPQNTQSEMAVPLVFGREILGVLDIQSTQVNAFREEDRYLFEALADTISVAIRNARLYQSERWRRQVAESLRDIAGMLTSAASPDEVLDAILTELERILPCDVAAIWLLDETYQPTSKDAADMVLDLAAIHGADPRDVERVKAIDPEKAALMIRVISTNQTHVRSAQDPVGPIGTALGYPPDYSSILTPLRVGDRSLGVLALAHATAGRYGSEAQAMTTAFASYAAVAIENNRLYAATQEQAWVATVMLQVAEATQSLNTVDELLSTVARLTPMLAGVRSATFFLFNPDSQNFSFASQYGLEPDQVAGYEKHPIYPGEASAFDQLRGQKSPVFLHHDPSAVRSSSHASQTLGHNPLVLFPLLSRAEVLGAFLVEHHHRHIDDQRSEAFSDHQMAILQGIVQQTTIAVENIRLLESKQEDAYVTAVLLQVAQAVVSSHDLDEILETILNILPVLVGIDASIIYLWDPNTHQFHPKTVAFGTWLADYTVQERSFSPEDHPLLQAVFERDAMVVCELGAVPQGPGHWHTLSPPQASQDIQRLASGEWNLLLGFPLTVKGQPLGVLLAQDASSTPENRLRRFEIINGVAQQAALAIENDRLTRERLDRERLEREFQLARQIQRSFLPESLPSTPGWEFDVRWRTARQVGGDFYDCFWLPGDRIGLVIADVSDKGIPAALYMTVARTLIRAASREARSPADTLARVNNWLLVDSRSGMFVTAVYAELSLSTGEMEYSIAGHNLPLFISDKQPDIVPLQKGGVALGVIDDLRLEDHSITLQPGDSIVFYTDGVTEAFVPPDQTYGESSLIGVLAACKGLTAAVVLEEVDRSLSNFLGDYPPSDDVTILAIHRCAG